MSIPPPPTASSLGSMQADDRPMSPGFLALVGAVAGGAPSLVMPTSTLIDAVGNAVMGALVVGILDVILLRSALEPHQQRRGRLLLVMFVSVALTLVTYRPAALVFQSVFDTAPPQTVRQLTVRASTRGFPGPVDYRLQFVAEPVAIQTLQERMAPLLKREGSAYAEFDGNNWAEFVKSHTDPAGPFGKAALDFTTPQGYYWSSKTRNGNTAKTLLLYDAATKLALAEHFSG